ncbi:MAG: hypothetical protein R3C59_13430 [Planctomycetaceae bacterium]
MSSVTISCPKCQADLKLPSRKLLGRKGKCPRCEHRFVLEEPDEVELTLAEPEAPVPADPVPQQPLPGTSPRWVPDDPALNGSGASVPDVGDPVFPAVPDIPAAAAANPFNFDQPPVAAAFPVPGGAGETHAAPGLDLTAAIAVPAESGSVTARVRGRRKKKGRIGAIGIGAGTALFVACMAGLWWQWKAQAQAEKEQQVAAARPAANPEWEQQKQEMAESNARVQQLSPTSGQPIPLQYLPFTPHLLVHLRPSEIWAADRINREFVATLGDLGVWLGKQIEDITRFSPQEIEEVTFALNFGPRSSPPDVAAVVRLTSEQTSSDMQLKRFQGQIRPDLDAPVFESDRYSYMLLDGKTFAVAPLTMSGELAAARTYSHAPSVDLEVLHAESDRQRQATLMFDLTNIDTHREFIFGDDMQHFADEFVLWFGTDVQTISWSLQLQPDTLYLETLVHPNNTSSAIKVQRTVQSQLQKLPSILQSSIRLMQPTTVGYRRMIGRFPAMLKATALGTSADVGPTYARLVTLLPAKAAANLAAASLFTWNQSVVTDFTQQTPSVARTPSLPNTVAERLKMPILVDFRRMPMQDAFAYIAEEIKTPIAINGDALKLAGMTQNIEQSYNLGEVPALQAIDAIVNNPNISDVKDRPVIVVDEATKSIQVTTASVAAASGLTTYDTKK